MYDILHGDCRLVLQELPDDSIDACVTDAPYGLSAPPDMAEVLRHWLNGDDGLVQCGPGFMAAEWDSFVPGPATWREVYRVLKPGGHLLCFAGTRTFDLMGISVRLAGFELRDSIDWVYLSGMPKSLDISKAIDKAAGAKRKVVGEKLRADGRRYRDGSRSNSGILGAGIATRTPEQDAARREATRPTTEDAERWSGWGTALKPAHEPILVCRKPLAESTVEKNVRKYGTGGINVDACRVATAPGDEVSLHAQGAEAANNRVTLRSGWQGMETAQTEGQKLGRWPPNMVFSHGPDCAEGACSPGCPVAELDRQSGAVGAAARASSPKGIGRREHGIFGEAQDGFRSDGDGAAFYSDKGGASRMFPVFDWSLDKADPVLFRYFAKAAPKERDAGLRSSGELKEVRVRVRKNQHPTVKPIALMRWLCKLVTPPGGSVLDPFAGSGTTGCAAVLEGFEPILIEREAEYLPLIEQRLAHWAQE